MFIFLLLHQIAVAFGCMGGYYYYAPKTTPVPTTVGKDALSRNVADSWGGHEVPDELKEKWKNWLDEYNANRLEEENDITNSNAAERGPGSGWPPSWIGFGQGFGGADVPPWSFIPVNTGLPDFCFLGPSKGKCDGKHKRFTYNPYIQRCVEFIWTGCDENQNNFVKKEECQRHCEREPMMDCDPTLFQYIEDGI